MSLINCSVRFQKVGKGLCKMSKIGQYPSHLKAYDGQILCMNTASILLLIAVFVAMRNRLPWQQKDILLLSCLKV